MSLSTLYMLEKTFLFTPVIFNLFGCVGPYSVEPFRNFKWTVCSLFLYNSSKNN